VSEAFAVARAAAARASVQIRELDTLAEMTAACALLDRIWQIPPGEVSEVRPSLLRALGHAGNYLFGAYATDGPRADELVAASVAFFGSPPGGTLHSHITGVLPGAGAGVGAAIKWHQRAWALAHGVGRVTWTYDPLIARNAFFNVTRLGARPRRYLVDFYGPMDDGPNRGQPTDRADVEWDLRSPEVRAAAAPVLAGRAGTDGPDVDALRSAGATVALAVGDDGEPARVESAGGTTGPLLIGVPADIEALRRTDPAQALRWRLAVRSVLGAAMADDARRITGFARSGWYVLEGKGPA
jgi:predicted GNAT superfamily acetyltransferase